MNSQRVSNELTVTWWRLLFLHVEIAMKRAQDKAEQAKSSLMESYRNYKEKSTSIYVSEIRSNLYLAVDANSRQRLRAYTESKKGDSLKGYSAQMSESRDSYERTPSQRSSSDNLSVSGIHCRSVILSQIRSKRADRTT